MTKYYVASRASLPERPEMWKFMRSLGVQITSTWIDEAGAGETDDLSELWIRILNEIKAADILVFYAEKNDFPFKGAMVEIGMALALDKPVYVVLNNVQLEGDTFKPLGSWCKHPNVSFKPNVIEALGLTCS